MRILFVCNYKPGVGGISGQVEALQRHLREENHIADVFSTKGSIIKRLSMSYKLKRIVRDYDVIHIHCCSKWGFLPAILGIIATRRSNKRTVLTYHGGGGDTFFSKHKNLIRYVLTRTDVNIVLSAFLGKVFDKYNLPYIIIPNIIELDESHYRVRESIRPDYICTRSHEKIYNIPCILRAFQQVQRNRSDATLTLVGDGSLHDELISLTVKMRLENVVFTGRVDNSIIYKYLDNAVFMLSSPTVDNMPVSLLEAMNSGLLVISSEVGGVPYMIENGKNGYLFKNGDDEGLANIMLRVLNSRDDFIRITENARKSLREYSWSSVKDSILSVYSNA